MEDDADPWDEFRAVALILAGFQCDHCATFFAPAGTFEAMGDAARDAGWFVDTQPRCWIVICPVCRASFSRSPDPR